MPPMTALGWFHTVMGILAIGTAAFTLRRHHFISFASLAGRVYLLITVVVAGSALMIFNQGGFGVGHVLAVMTLAAVAVGALLERRPLLGGFSIYLQTAAYSATVLFHMVPAIADFLRRLPVGDPFVQSLDAPLVRTFHLAFLALFALGVLWQWRALKREHVAGEGNS
ncbi:MAG: hypothetical protein VW642_03485 [Halieaceae bacterium]|jgi:uncharacterized membrane protein